MRRRGVTAAALTALLLSACPRAPDKPPEPKPVSVAPSKLELAEAAWGDGNSKAAAEDFWGAIAYYDKAIGLAPDLAELYVARGSAYVALQNYNQAFADFRAAIEGDPQLASAYYARASLYWLLGELDEAEREYANLVRLRPDDDFYARRYARVLFDQGKAIEMENFYRAALRGHAEREWAALGLLDAVENNAGVSTAITEGVKLYESGIRGPGIRSFIGSAHFQNKNSAEAVKWLRPLLQHDANEVSLEAISALAQASARTHDPIGCVDVMRTYWARQGRPTVINANNELARCQQWETEAAAADVPATMEVTH